jgi:hypothetical protein
VHLAGHGDGGDLGIPRLGDRLANGAAGRAPPVGRVGLGPAGGRHQHRVLGPAPAEDRARAGHALAACQVGEADHKDLDCAGAQVNPDHRSLTAHSAHLSGR